MRYENVLSEDVEMLPTADKLISDALEIDDDGDAVSVLRMLGLECEKEK